MASVEKGNGRVVSAVVVMVVVVVRNTGRWFVVTRSIWRARQMGECGVT